MEEEKEDVEEKNEDDCDGDDDADDLRLSCLHLVQTPNQPYKQLM